VSSIIAVCFISLQLGRAEQEVMSMVVHNRALKEGLELLLKRVLPHYRGLDIGEPEDIGIIEFQGQSIEKLEEYKLCLDIMLSDPIIKFIIEHAFNLILGVASYVSDPGAFLFWFIEAYFLQNRSFDSHVFDSYYGKFEDFFNADTLAFTDTVRLHAFESEVDEIDLGEGMVIRRLKPSQNEIGRFMRVAQQYGYPFDGSAFVLQRTYQRAYVRPEKIDKQRSTTSRSDEARDLFDTLMKALRVLKPSGVYRDTDIITEVMMYYPITLISNHYSIFRLYKASIENNCILSFQEGNTLKSLFKKMRMMKDDRFRIALDRLNFGMARDLDEDRFLDYMIGLEALYLPDGNDELSFRLSLRVAFTVAQGMKKRKDTFRFMRGMYTQRSNIAHGNKKKNLTPEDVLWTEEILRLSLKKYLEDETLFTVDKKNNNGKLVKEGVLDSIYFEEQRFFHIAHVQDILEAGLVGDRERVRASGELLLQLLESDKELLEEERVRVVGNLRRSLEHHPPEGKNLTDHPATGGDQDQGAGPL
jgi:hypothetical protein